VIFYSVILLVIVVFTEYCYEFCCYSFNFPIAVVNFWSQFFLPISKHFCTYSGLKSVCIEPCTVCTVNVAQTERSGRFLKAGFLELKSGVIG
jgi:hypothetical protein